MKAQQLWFTKPGKVELRESELGLLAEDDVLVKTLTSGISAGSEMLVYRGQLPKDIPLDTSIKAFDGLDGSFPLPYGYACVGIIAETGSALSNKLKGKKVFAFQPHASHFICKTEQVIFLPDEMTIETGIFLANMETAVNFFIDGAVQHNDKVAIIGAGVVGLLLNDVLNFHYENNIAVIDTLKIRRELAAEQRHTSSLDPDSKAIEVSKFDLIFELSGNPQALNMAIEMCDFAGRIIVGSWYGNKPTALNLGGAFHRNRLKLISSQVSTISPEHSADWTKDKRLQKAMSLLTELDVGKYITHRFALSDANKAYSLLDKVEDQTLQVIFTYED